MPKLLLVEDNEENREILTRRLARRGYDVVEARHGMEGIELAGSARPDIILMDMTLPGIDGSEVAARLKANPETCSIPVIALTAHASEADRENALAAGFDDFDTKPVDMERLLQKVENSLRKGHSK
jgi:two-component system, cell cycle response regulator DivK